MITKILTTIVIPVGTFLIGMIVGYLNNDEYKH